MDLSTHSHSDWIICGVSGDITIFTTYQLREYLLNALDSPGHRLLVDLSGVTSMDTNGLAVLVFIKRMALQRGGTLALFAPTKEVRGLLESSGLARTFPVIVELPAPRQAEQARDRRPAEGGEVVETAPAPA